jgi:hypothetical protein
MATSNNSDCADFYFTQGSCSIILKEGDLLKETEVDVLVIPTPDSSELNPDNFVIYKNFYSRADEDQKREIKRLRYDLKLLHPQVISKNGRGCILAVPPFLGKPNKAQELLQKTYTSCLNLAVKHNFRKIAFPTIGCGVIGFDTKAVARIVYSVFENFIQTTDGKKMNEIRVVIFNNKVWNDFTTIFLDLSDSKHTKIKLTDTYELLHSELCFTFDSPIVHPSNVRFVSIFILDHQKSRDQPRCQRKKMKNQHHNDILTKQMHRSNDY